MIKPTATVTIELCFEYHMLYKIAKKLVIESDNQEYLMQVLKEQIEILENVGENNENQVK